MTYLVQSQLETDPDFQRRNYSCLTQQANYFIGSAGLDHKALAESVLRGEMQPQQTLLRMNAAGPGIADKVDNGDGTIDQSKCTDDDLLSMTQAAWPQVAQLYYNEDGTRK